MCVCMYVCTYVCFILSLELASSMDQSEGVQQSGDSTPERGELEMMEQWEKG